MRQDMTAHRRLAVFDDSGAGRPYQGDACCCLWRMEWFELRELQKLKPRCVALGSCGSGCLLLRLVGATVNPKP